MSVLVGKTAGPMSHICLFIHSAMKVGL